ncbi:MAG TPA: DEAD/DEAH box helicase [Thermoanaerobaculia bacterium]
MSSDEPTAPPTFAALGLSDDIVATLAELGYEAPTPIQEKTIPVLLQARDLIGQAQTGTGKTAAFALPILQQLDPSSKKTQALVLCPTRELAMQVADALHSYAKRPGNVSVLPVYGGAPIVHQLKRLERGVQIVVGTPGRLIDHLDRGSLDLSTVKMIVLDEADEMLKMGFIDDIERILGSAPKERQTALFSATMPDEVLRIAKRYQNDPARIEIEHKTMTAPAIEQRFLNVAESQKLEVLTQILELEQSDAVLIFRRTKNGAAELAEILEGRGFSAAAMHGDMTQTLRESVIRRLRAGQIEVVVATDVAARGLDVEQISHVVNYDIPYDVEAYVHRIGRTGRAGRTGIATLFITPRERRMMREIERYTGMQIKPMKMPTRADVAAARIAAFKELLRKELAQGELDLYLELVEQLSTEGTYDMAEVAAAAARMASSGRPLRPDGPAVAEQQEQERPARSYASSSSAPSAAPSRSATWERRERSFDRPAADKGGDRGGNDEPKVRLSMAVGKRDGIRPADVVGSIANEADIPGRDIGPIDIREEITYVTVPTRHVDNVLEKVKRAKFRGRPVNLKVAGPEDERPPRRDRDEDDRPPRRDYDRDDRPPRTGGYNRDDRPPRTGGYNRDDRPRSGGYDREERPRTGGYSPRPGGFSPRPGASRPGASRPGGGGSRPGGGGGFAPRGGGGFAPRTGGAPARPGRPSFDRDRDRDDRPSRPSAFSRFSKGGPKKKR